MANQKSNALTKSSGLSSYSSYMSLSEVNEKLEKGELSQGVLRINPKNYNDAYMSASGDSIDILINGIYDRNCALHGDLVAVQLYPEEKWKVLYDQLDYLLDEDEALKQTVYATQDAFEVMDLFVPPKGGKKSPDVVKESTATKDDEKDKANAANTKKKGNRRKNKNKKRDDVKVDESQNITDKLIPKENRDKVTLISHNLTKANVEKFTAKDGKKEKGQPIIVPPDQLSSCSDITDDESACSDEIDIDGALQDHAFFKAQRLAGKKGKKRAAQREMAAAGLASTGIDATVNRAEAAQCVDASVQPMQGTSKAVDSDRKLKHDEQKHSEKRPSTVENLFGDKMKQGKCSKSKSSQNVDNEMANLTAKAENVEIDSKSVSTTQHEAIQSIVPEHFMISPYNQQINICATQVRAQNNLLNHPLLNSFPNYQPVSNVTNSNPNQGVKNKTANPNVNNYQRPRENNRTVPSVAQVMRLANWPRYIQKTAFVVHILDARNTRLGAGILKPFADMNRNFALFSPNDSRIPRMKIPMSQCPRDFFARAKDYSKRIYLAEIYKWTDPKYAMGKLVRDIGEQGEIASETEALLLQLGIDYSPFPDVVLGDLPTVPETGWTIPDEAFKGRLDLRDKCIFTIDPATARDLDDALSCECLPNQRYRVGVHIADVSYFIPQNSELDKFAADRATSVYLVDQVIPMLPRVLSEQLCSLNPNEDRLTFSVIWELDRFGHVLKSWFGRTVIRSCTKLSYSHAQSMIDNPQKTDWEEGELPYIEGYTAAQITNVVQSLNSLARHMRARRVKNGALRLDQSKIGFSLDWETKTPVAITPLKHTESNFLVEEFMLLANISVAHKIHESFPQFAVLRCHPEPQSSQLEDLTNVLRTLHIQIDTSCAGAIYRSLEKLMGDDEFSDARVQVIVNMLSKPMQNALYFCSGTFQEDFRHYALNVPFYTHFTSPIRRYPDLMVHRLLASASDPERYPFKEMKLDEIDRRLLVSNDKKTSAKRASEYSNEIFLAEFVKRCKEVVLDGIVTGVLDHALDILLLDFCTIKRAYLENLPLDELLYIGNDKNAPPTLHTVWKADPANELQSCDKSYSFFTRVRVVATPFTNDQLKFNITLIRPSSLDDASQ